MLRFVSILALAALFFMAAALLPAQTSTPFPTLPPMVGVVISGNLPAFASLPVRPNFTPMLHVFAQRTAATYFYQVTVNYADGEEFSSLHKVPSCACESSETDWRQVLTMGLKSKIVTGVKVSPILTGAAVPVTLSQ